MNYSVNCEEIHDYSGKLFGAILKEQRKIDKLRGPDPALLHLTEKTVGDYKNLFQRSYCYPFLGSGRGHGPFCEMVDHSVKYDLSSLIAPNLLGHSHPIYIKSHLESAAVNSILGPGALPGESAFLVAKRTLDSLSSTSLVHFSFASSANHAKEQAIEMIRKKSDPKKRRIITFSTPLSSENHGPLQDDFFADKETDSVAHFNPDAPESSLDHTIQALKSVVTKYQKTHCAICIKIVQNDFGINLGNQKFYEGIFKWARDNELFIWVDEIDSFARTPELFSFQNFALDAYIDLVSVGGCLQISGVLFSRKFDSPAHNISESCLISLVSANAGEKIVRYIVEGNFLGPHGRIAYLQHTFFPRLQHLAAGHMRHKIGKVNGHGTLFSFAVGDGSAQVTSDFLQELFTNGIIAYSTGPSEQRVHLDLPLCLLDEHIDEIFRIIEKTLETTIEG